ncbi:chymotrypsinogen A-like [Chrysoperla carnea]|uniref:chymotrypsinogen A-like n=1 Tax=Chrysoperla carnea TaxID=189513 RepID=UPI001D07C487|nr:chymotrypsinogen A-like [Chrysoperla carnea]
MNKFASLWLVFAIIGAAYSAPAAEADGDDRILNGRKAATNQYPFIVSLQYKMPSEPGTILRSKFCGGSILNKRWILTAAHCIVNGNKDGGVMHVKAGVKNAFDLGGQYPRVQKIIWPTQYNKTGQEEHDIALLQLAEELVMGPAVQPIAMAPKGFKASGVGTILGWGAINEDHSQSSNELLYTPIPVAPSSDCDIFRAHRPAEHICLGGKGGGSACGGDSGGPFILTHNGKPLLVGATSFGTVKCTNDKPVVYTSVAAYRDWIDETMAKN